jgi:hypothetical protein
LQQGLNEWLRSQISICGVLSNSLALDRQELNQQLALDGSRTGDWSTIDLSSASDLLSQQTVEAVFGRFTRFYELMQLSRTPSVKIGVNHLQLKKYAGMGNATTFPVQSVCFTVLCIASMLPEKFGYRDVVRAAKRVRVYGDDIIIRTSDFERFQYWAISFGLKINHSKTFSTGNFRESCGVDAFCGIDVTPCYLRYDPVLARKSPSAFASLVSTSNQLWLRGYYSCAKFLEDVVERVHSLPLIDKESSALGWHTRQNVTTYQRWSSSLHRFEVRSYVLSPKKRKDILDGLPALMKFFHLPGLSEDDRQHLELTTRRFNVKLRSRWVASR